MLKEGNRGYQIKFWGNMFGVICFSREGSLEKKEKKKCIEENIGFNYLKNILMRKWHLIQDQST